MVFKCGEITEVFDKTKLLFLTEGKIFMKTSKKVICLLLTLIMVVSSLPSVAVKTEAATIKFTYKFKTAEGTGSMPNQPRTYGVKKALPANKFERPGYVFDGWVAHIENNKKTGTKAGWLYEKNGDLKWLTSQKSGWTLKKFKDKDNSNFITKPLKVKNGDVITFKARWRRIKIIDVAENQVGNNHKKYTDWYGVNSDWCGMFVSWCANKAGVLNKSIPKAAACSQFVKWFKNKKQFHTEKESKYIPVPGDLIFYDGDRGNYSDPNMIYSHIGIVISYNKKTKQITTIEGNVSNKVKKRTQKRTGHMAFAHPKY